MTITLWQKMFPREENKERLTQVMSDWMRSMVRKSPNAPNVAKPRLYK